MPRLAIVPNPSVRGGRRAVTVAVTDRAQRYRANASRPPGDRCQYCGAAGGRPDVEHVDGKEANGTKENLALACRSCNTSKGLVFRGAKIGRPTRQYNPSGAPSLAAYRQAAAVLTGRAAGSLAAAIGTVQATPPAKRAAYAARLQNPAPKIPTFEQYVRALKMHTKGAYDEGGAVIHATPPAVRKEYQSRINAFTAPQRRATAQAKRQAERDRWE